MSCYYLSEYLLDPTLACFVKYSKISVISLLDKLVINYDVA